jgi:diacylglycerol kinase (ATP)
MSRFSWKQRAVSVTHALRGLKVLVASEHNARLHVAAALVVGVLGTVLQVSLADWRWLLLCIAGVWVAEAFNTALERLCDRVSLERHPLMRDAKDVAAAAVLLSCVSALCIGGLTLWPHVVALWAATAA